MTIPATTLTQLVDAYLAALGSADVDAVLALFTPDAIVSSPLYGEQPARDFYTDIVRRHGRIRPHAPPNLGQHRRLGSDCCVLVRLRLDALGRHPRTVLRG